jgi:hypothetical protein
MSRLDDELRLALQREEPSQGFADRVMRQIAAAPARKPRLRESLARLIAPLRMRWVVVGVTASLIVAIGMLQLGKSQKPVYEPRIESARRAEALSQPPLPTAEAASSQVAATAEKAPATVERAKQRRVKRASSAASRSRRELAAQREGEAARDKLLLALRIASETLYETQRLIQGED